MAVYNIVVLPLCNVAFGHIRELHIRLKTIKLLYRCTVSRNNFGAFLYFLATLIMVWNTFHSNFPKTVLINQQTKSYNDPVSPGPCNCKSKRRTLA